MIEGILFSVATFLIKGWLLIKEKTSRNKEDLATENKALKEILKRVEIARRVRRSSRSIDGMRRDKRNRDK